MKNLLVTSIIITIICVSLSTFAQKVFYEDFSTNHNNWVENSKMYFQNGRYHIFDKEMGQRSYIRIKDVPSDLYRYLSIDIYFEEGETGQAYGVLFRASDIDNAFALLFANQGYYSLGKISNGNYSKIISWSQIPEGFLRNGKNNISILYNNKYIHATINEVYLFTITSEEYPDIYSSTTKGGVGFYSAKGVHSSFDELLLQDEDLNNQ